MKIHFFYIAFIVFLLACKNEHEQNPFPTNSEQIFVPKYTKEQQDSIVDVYLEHGAKKYSLYSHERQEELDRGLAADSTIAELWQQKSMPLFKQGKYELGMKYVDKAVQYDRLEYQDYRAFIKCIFAKTYQASIDDFEDCISRFGNTYVMDHTCNFYIALCKIQLNQFAEAEQILKNDIATEEKKHQGDWTHHLDWFYLGIAQYEQDKFTEAINTFDKALKKYPEFSDVQWYKAVCLAKLEQYDKAQNLADQALINGKLGYTINEDNVVYERYPYQIRWELR